jgi:very-short-patch-repair endonuclease
VPRLPEVPDALLQGPFTTAEARESGISTSALRGAEWRHVFRDVWAHTAIEDTVATRVAAARLVLGAEGFLCGLTAAWVYGIEAQDRRSDLVWIGRPTGSWRMPRSGCLVREITVESTDLELAEGALITNPLRTVFDCARWLSLVEAVVVADALAHQDRIDLESLAKYVSSHRGLRGIRQADLVLSLIEPLSESPMETRLRLLLVRAGFQVPVAQHVVADQRGQFVARLDLAYPDLRIAVEYDGALHWDQRREDDRRRDRVRELGWQVFVASASDYYTNPQPFLAQLRRALAAQVA